jgi:hypothetical protein
MLKAGEFAKVTPAKPSVVATLISEAHEPHVPFSHTQCAAVSTHVGAIRTPEQNVFTGLSRIYRPTTIDLEVTSGLPPMIAEAIGAEGATTEATRMEATTKRKELSFLRI